MDNYKYFIKRKVILYSEWRHAHGMRCLGIPNTAHFANITLIEDAAQLWEKLKVTREMERFRPDVEVLKNFI
jgi:splicing factor 3A subunit 3